MDKNFDEQDLKMNELERDQGEMLSEFEANTNANLLIEETDVGDNTGFGESKLYKVPRLR